MLSPKELEYLAENEPIEIVPNFGLNKIFLISGDVGPFKPGIPLQVPLWMAIDLRKSSKCKIVTPDWMTVEVLDGVKKEEINSPLCTPLPSEYFMAIGKLLFEVSPADINNADEVKTLMKDIWDVRSSKLRRDVKLFLSQPELPISVEVNNLTMMELCSIRPFLTHSLEQIHRIKHNVSDTLAVVQDSQSQSMSMSTMSMSNSQSQSQ